MDVAFDHLTNEYLYIHRRVSILVLVDVAFDLEFERKLNINKESFNPCFSGCCF